MVRNRLRIHNGKQAKRYDKLIVTMDGHVSNPYSTPQLTYLLQQQAATLRRDFLRLIHQLVVSNCNHPDVSLLITLHYVCATQPEQQLPSHWTITTRNYDSEIIS